MWVILVFRWVLFKMKLCKWEVSCYVSISNLVFADSPTIMNLNTKISVALRTKMQNESHVRVLNLESTLSHETGAWKPGVLFPFSHFPLPHKSTESRPSSKNAKIENFCFWVYTKNMWVILVFRWVLFKMKLCKWEVSCYVSISNLVLADSPTIMNLNTKISVALRTKMQNESHVRVLNLERTLSHEKGAWKPGVLFPFSHFPLPHKSTESRPSPKNAKIEHLCFWVYTQKKSKNCG